MAEPGFNKGEVSCTCGATFDTVGELISHASSVHGTEVE
jgi:hypothetical protein